MPDPIGLTMRITNALLSTGELVDLTVNNGTISLVEPADTTRQLPTDHDLDGWLLLPAMAEPHAHLDKALTADLVPNPAGDLGGAIEAWIDAATSGRITVEGTVERAASAMEMLLVRGVTAVRSHVNVGAGYGAAQVHAVHEARDRLGDLLHVQTVALVHSPLMGSDGAGNRAALDEAVDAGVDVVGGCPHLEPDGAGMIAHVLQVASDAGLPLDLHVDETLDTAVLTLPEFARQVIDTGFANGASASHCVSLGMQTESVQHDVAAVVGEAGMAVITLPQTNLFLQSRGIATAAPRGLTAIDALVDAGVNVAAGADNVQDPFNLVGRSDPLETAALLVMAGHRTPEDAYHMVSNAPRMAMGLAPVNFEVGDPADFVAIDAPTVRAAIADAPITRQTFTAGRLVASATQHTTVSRP